jgi:cobalt-zinc-cadmium efflux system membrane fusion protein
MKIKQVLILAVTILTLLSFSCSQPKDTKNSHNKDSLVEKEHNHKEEHEVEISLTENEMKEFGVQLAKAQKGYVSSTIKLPGEITVNTDKLAHIAPRFSGTVTKVFVSLGDKVKKGQVLAVISSRELADSKAEYLASLERFKLASSVYKREETLMEKQITSKQEYLDAKKAFVEAKINLNVAEQKLHSFGFSEQYLKTLTGSKDENFTKYEIKAPFDGTVLEKHITLGENIQIGEDIFTIGDLSTVWVNLTVFPKYLHYVKKGQTVVVKLGNGFGEVNGKIDFIAPVVLEETRTATARVVLQNKNGNLMPGTFVEGVIEKEKKLCNVIVPLSAIQTIEGKPSVFVKDKHGFEVKHIETGIKDSKFAEVKKGINLGDMCVVKGSFTVKAEMEKGSIKAGHSH